MMTTERSAPEKASSISGLILAAGLSRRMGRPKTLLPLAGRPLLAHVIQHAQASCLHQLILVLGEKDANAMRDSLALESWPQLRLVLNAEPQRGQSLSLQLGLAAVDPAARAAAVLLGDQPGVDAALIDRVAEAFLAGDAPAARPVWRSPGGEALPGHPVFVARRLFAHFDALRGDEGARALWQMHPEWLREIPLRGAPPADVDTWQDYQHLAGLPTRRE